MPMDNPPPKAEAILKADERGSATRPRLIIAASSFGNTLYERDA
jgi:hypothetical protein